MEDLALGDDHCVPVHVLHHPVLHDGAAGVAALHHQVLLWVEVAGAVASVLVLAHRLPYRLVGGIMTLPDHLASLLLPVLHDHVEVTGPPACLLIYMSLKKIQRLESGFIG